MSAYFDSIHPKLDVSHPDVCSYVNEYLHYVAVIKGHSLQTAFNYYEDLKEFFRYLAVSRHLCAADAADAFDQKQIDAVFLRSITSTEIYEFLYMLQQQKNCKATTRNRKLSALRGFFKYLTVSVNVLEKDPTGSVESAKNAKVLPKYLTKEQAVELLSNVQSDFYERDFCILTLFLNCGMRLQELVKIDLVDIKEDTILLHGKGNKERTTYLTPACLDAMKHYLRERAKMPNIQPTDKGALFLSRRTGRRLSPRRIQQIVERCLQTAGLAGKGFSTHKLRHTAATLMYQTGDVDILELKELLGHANVATTQIYTHLDTSQLRSAVNASPLSRVKYIQPEEPDATPAAAEADGQDKVDAAQPTTQK
ncbi:MAG: tyrosine-type recombinase/integrase [Faecalibacterium sp.]|jgi:site-specific recombinase XerD|nr:tyrosine-type recombinase/integrase [Faecalibacterium sp.]